MCEAGVRAKSACDTLSRGVWTQGLTMHGRQQSGQKLPPTLLATSPAAQYGQHSTYMPAVAWSHAHRDVQESTATQQDTHMI